MQDDRSLFQEHDTSSAKGWRHPTHRLRPTPLLMVLSAILLAASACGDEEYEELVDQSSHALSADGALSCFIDTPKLDQFEQGYCAGEVEGEATVLFGAPGVPASQVTFWNGCDRVWTSSSGRVCSRKVKPSTVVTQYASINGTLVWARAEVIKFSNGKPHKALRPKAKPSKPKKPPTHTP